jgi:hypothetical protein
MDMQKKDLGSMRYYPRYTRNTPTRQGFAMPLRTMQRKNMGITIGFMPVGVTAAVTGGAAYAGYYFYKLPGAVIGGVAALALQYLMGFGIFSTPFGMGIQYGESIDSSTRPVTEPAVPVEESRIPTELARNVSYLGWRDQNAA